MRGGEDGAGRGLNGWTNRCRIEAGLDQIGWWCCPSSERVVQVVDQSGSRRHMLPHEASRIAWTVQPEMGGQRITNVVRPLPETGAKSRTVMRLYQERYKQGKARRFIRMEQATSRLSPPIGAGLRFAAVRGSAPLSCPLRPICQTRHRAPQMSICVGQEGGSLANTNECAMPPKSAKSSAMSRRILEGIV